MNAELTVRARILDLLRARDLEHRIVTHDLAYTAAEAAAARGTALAIGGKSLVMKIGDTDRFGVFAVAADQRTHGRTIRRHLKVSRLRFATPEELAALTGLTPGCVPPFGRPIFELDLYVDAALAAQDEIAFTAGDHGCSIIMPTAAWLDAARPTATFPCTRPPQEPS